MKILQVHNSYGRGGGEDNVARSEADLLHAAGHEVVEYRVSNPSTVIRSVGSLVLSSWNPLSARTVDRLIDEHNPDIAHIHNTWYRLSPTVIRSLKKSGVPVVVTVHNYRLMCANAVLYRAGAPCVDCVGTHPWRGVSRRCYRGSLVASAAVASNISIHRAIGTWSTQVDRFVVATDFLRDVMVKSGIPRERIRKLPIAVADPGERPQPPSNSRSVLLVGRLDAEKGVSALLEKWGQVDNGLELVVIGDGPGRAALEAMDVPRVRFTGWIEPESVAREMLAARALVFPSVLFETFGLSIVEAFAAGLPVIANDIGTRPEIIGREGAGWLVSSGDDWRAALSGLGSDVEVDRSGLVARRRYKERFAPGALMPELEILYGELMTHKPV